ncbi:serine/threonine-protein kinase [Thermomonospora cellulosilytica]|uniref:non-specific serine/threonine protein kinase n=1 Tax=Thermomonospora cellulosilytica TaxID=1411118 RepID=A0A7W3MSQ6_9ACTN|nr:serine/threonine-protein kinase [Thermomonospora cellulosilytica]MBA9001166.1 serine/threonine-protein kinase [Thermomonospora cellulosilytica]
MAEWRVAGFREIRELGRGGQGRVVLAAHEESGTPVAVKYLAAGAGEADRDEFEHEARMLGQVDSPHVARLYRLVRGEHGTAIVMEAVDGVSLKRILAEHGALEPEAALTVLKGSLLGLAAAHHLGVVHRDYKPANVIVRADGLSKLIDFGVARYMGEAGGGGTPAYMAPEQWRSEPVTPVTDVYAATCVFFECVTGRRPFAGDGIAELRRLHLTAPVPVAGVPEPLRPLVAKGMAKSPWERPAGAAAFVEELESVASAAFGAQWEERGVRVLAGAAAALAALFPLTALGLASSGVLAAGSGGAGAAAGAAAHGTAGATAAGSAGTGLVGVAGAKGAAAVAGTAVLAVTAGTAVYVTRDEPPPPLTVTLAAHQEAATSLPFRVTGQLVRVRGGADPALTRRINGALRAPVDARAAELRDALARFPGDPSTPLDTTMRVTPSVRLSGPQYLSVRYDFAPDSRALWHSTWHVDRTVTVDLRTGAVLRPSDHLAPSARGQAGLSALRLLLREFGTGTCFADQPPEIGVRHLDDAAIQFALTERHLEVLPDGPALGLSTACSQPTIAIPYERAAALLRPEVLKAIPRPSPS